MLTLPPSNNGDAQQSVVPTLKDVAPIIQRLVFAMERRGLLHGDSPIDVLDRALRYARAYLRSATLASMSTLSNDSLKSLLVLEIFKTLLPQKTTRLGEQRCPIVPNLPEGCEYQASLHYQPKYQVGGDTACFHVSTDSTLWVMLADVMGKGVPAHLSASSLRVLWDIGHAESVADEPLAFLKWLETQLKEYLPEFVFIETTIFIAHAGGIIEIAAAGISEFFVGNLKERRVASQSFGGMYLGKGYPELFSVQEVTIGLGHEIVFATDGVFDQSTGDTKLRSTIRERVLELSGVGSIHKAVVQIIQDSINAQPQFDDITVVSLQRTEAAAGSEQS